jgi:CRISPR-associated endonuclease/helicase Cas3
MSDALSDRFDEFFEAVYPECSPFPWQRRLASRVIAGDWPKAIAVPTASGKTTCIDIAVFALACQAGNKLRTAPRRIFFVVDRRVVVDQAFEHARCLARKLTKADEGILKEVADRLRRLCDEIDTSPLACFQLRGGMYRDDAWARTPTQPTIIASTVDQIGSRLLYRGYGLRSGFARPVHAGLAGNDSLIILDEAHCANPFQQTLSAIKQYRDWAERRLDSPFGVVVMSATPPAGTPPEDCERLQDDDRAHPILGPRIRAEKPARLVEAKKAKNKDAFSLQVAHEARDMRDSGARIVGIIVNRVATAVAVYELLSQTADCDAILLTGRMRPIDRDRVWLKWQEFIAAKKTRLPPPRPLFVVATQCLEVGADVDFDALVTECASLDALRQRFGRLNRLGRADDSGKPIVAPATIVIRAEQVTPKEDDPVYGPALSRTWQWLCGHAVVNENGIRVIDLGIRPLEKILGDDLAANPQLLHELNAPAPDAPVMLPAHVDCWVQTDPVPCPDPDVSLFLHGPRCGKPEIQVLWRADIDPAADPKAWIRTVALCEPTSRECMTVPLHLFREWWNGRGSVLPELTDVEGGTTPTDSSEPSEPPSRRALRWQGPDNSEVVEDANKFQPGDTIVLPVQAGGWDELGHIPKSENGDGQVDCADEANFAVRGKAVLRLHPALLANWPDTEFRASLLSLLAPEQPTEDDVNWRGVLQDALVSKACPKSLTGIVEELANDKRLTPADYPAAAGAEQPPGVVLIGSRRVRDKSDETELFTHEDDSSLSTGHISLVEHCEKVGEYAQRFASACGLDPELLQDVTLAASLHDIGKADPRFQAWLFGGNPWIAAAGELLAKSARLQTSAARASARTRSGYPQGGRHELLSVRLAEGSPVEAAHDPDLVLHLIASHHGRCRPFAPWIDDPTPVDVSLPWEEHTLTARSDTNMQRLDSGVAERFWRLVRRYGWWGLAWLEAIVVLADHRRSEDEEHNRNGSSK